jgi:hypothetical protein
MFLSYWIRKYDHEYLFQDWAEYDERNYFD